ncbi:MAG: preprotein translocase subunit SecE [Candidatus Shapirobacteria bacterium]
MRFTPLSFLNEVQDELKKVTWPNKQETLKLTGVVVFISVLVGVYVGALDFTFTKVMALMMPK